MNRKAIPIPIRRLRATMEMKALSVGDVSKITGQQYGVTSSILTGRLRHEEGIRQIEEAITAAPIGVEKEKFYHAA